MTSRPATSLPAGAILAGGRATRLGGVAKGLLEVGGRRMVDRVAEALRPVTSQLWLVTGAVGAEHWVADARVVSDVLAGGGSAAGVHAALVAARGPLLAVAWDLPFVSPRLLSALVEAASESDVDAVVPRSGDGVSLEPACAWYGVRCAEAIAHGWATGDRSLHGLLGRVRTRVLESDGYAGAGSADYLFLNVNTERDLQRAREWSEAGNPTR